MKKEKLCDVCKKEKAVFKEYDTFYSCAKCMWKEYFRNKKKLAKPFEQARKWIEAQ